MLGCFARRWRVGDAEATLLETHDWFSLPSMRGSGVGARLLLRVMALGRPILVAGGSEDTLALLPRLGWTALDTAATFVLPADPEDLGAELVDLRRHLHLAHLFLVRVPQRRPPRLRHRMPSFA